MRTNLTIGIERVNEIVHGLSATPTSTCHVTNCGARVSSERSFIFLGQRNGLVWSIWSPPKMVVGDGIARPRTTRRDQTLAGGQWHAAARKATPRISRTSLVF